MKWEKCGLVIKPNPKLWWMRTHAMIPTPQKIEGSTYRLYFSGRDDLNRSHVGYAVIDLNEPETVLEISSEPVLAPGRLGCFDDNGVTPSCVVSNGSDLHMYYIGWNPGSTVRMHIFGGLAISRDGGRTFLRHSEAPIIERCQVNPFLNTAPFVLQVSEKEWRMYYVSGVEWVHRDLPRYNIQLATSRDGLDWIREGVVCIDFEPGENALARPYVVNDDGLFKMYFAAKGEAYRLKYAESTDGVRWVRTPGPIATLAPSENGPDSQMMEYAAVLEYRGRRILYYNGNDYGREGICLALGQE